MTTKESNIVHEAPTGHYVYKEKGSYTVYRPTITHAVSDSSYALTEDGLSIAKARCDYLARSK